MDYPDDMKKRLKVLKALVDLTVNQLGWQQGCDNC